MDLSKIRASSAKRMVNGTEVPRQGATSCGVRAAMKKGGSAYAGESGEVEGEASRPRLDRPARKHGGCVMKADGGRVLDDDVIKGAAAGAVYGAGGGAMGKMGKMAGAKLGEMMKERLNDARNVAPSMGRKSGGAVKKKC
jgi:hypothetical protein